MEGRAEKPLDTTRVPCSLRVSPCRVRAAPFHRAGAGGGSQPFEGLVYTLQWIGWMTPFQRHRLTLTRPLEEIAP